MSEDRPRMVVLAGPNGAGKSTFFDLYLRQTGLQFVNADMLARELFATDASTLSYEAAKLAAVQRELLVQERESFCMETVFSDPVSSKLDFLVEAQRGGYRVTLIFIGLDSPELSLARVIERVASGGHDVPDEKIFGRFPRTLANLKAALSRLDEVLLYDNSDAENPYRLVAKAEAGQIVEKHPPIPSWLDGVLE